MWPKTDATYKFEIDIVTYFFYFESGYVQRPDTQRTSFINLISVFVVSLP